MMNLQYSNLFKHDTYQAKISPNQHYVANAFENRLVIRQHSQELSIFKVYECAKAINAIEWSPNSEYILTVNYEFSRIDIWSIMDTNFRSCIKDPRLVIVRVKWTPDSKNILYTVDFQLWMGIWNLSKATFKQVHHIKYSDKAIEVSPDGEYVAVAVKKNGKDWISIFHSYSFILLDNFEVDTADLQNFKWSPDSMYIAVWDNRLYHKLVVYRSDGFKCMNYIGYEYGLGIKTVHWSPNGQLLALGNFNQTIHLINTSSWKLIDTLHHPATVSRLTDTSLVEEMELPRTVIPNISKPLVGYRHITGRPYTISTIQPDINKPNPKIGIGLMQFSADSLYIYSRNDNMPHALWIWQVKTLQCFNIVLFKHPIRQAIWNPQEEHMLVVICGDEHMHVIQPTDSDDQIEIMPLRVPLAEFTVKKAQWNSNGNSLVLMNDDLFGLAVM